MLTASLYVQGVTWWPEYDYPLGPPLGDAVYDDTTKIWSRYFASGTNVTLGLDRKPVGDIAWASM